MLQYIILGMLCYEELTGYDLKKNMEHGVGVFFKASYGSLYPALKKLTDQGHVTVREEATGGRRKKVYSLTGAGRAVFMEWLAAPADSHDNPSYMLSKVYFFDMLPAAQRTRQISEYELSCLQYLHKLETLERDLRAREGLDNYYYKVSTLYYGLAVIREALSWIRQIKDRQPLTLTTHESEV